MKNNLEAGSDKNHRSDNAFYARLTPGRLLVGVLSITLLLLSLIGAIAIVTSTHAIAARATLATNSVTKHTLVPADTSTPTTTPSPTSTPSITPTTPTTTPSPTSTSTPAPTPTTAMTPTPTSTSMPSPTSTSIPSPTSPASSNPSLSPTRSSNTADARTTPVATSTATVTAMGTQSSGQGQTPTTSSTFNTIKNASQDRQNAGFPFIALAIGVPGTTAAIVFFFIGWWLLRKRLLPVKKVKLPPSGADPWSRVRTSDTPWNMNVNGSTQPAGSNNQLYNGPAPWGHNSVVPSGIPFNGNIAPSYSSPEANRPQATGNSINDSYEMDAEAYEQWLRNNPEGPPDLNNPYLKELIKQYSDKSRAARQQKLSGTSNEQASQTQNDDKWLR